MKQRRQIGIFTLIVIGVGVGLLIKNVRIGLLIGLGIGLFAGSLIRNR
ncbi:hypothetical protein [Sediminibacterium goheungense]|jgi:hypothetical protein|uniref:Uncharacterized protein n=1 Tax=Sediminibacterium goheungense TaxID=1086393 RepID=A0A4R6J0U2_9BACT|nr:hypothetical protein [Sediminibacterium goheungense]TDO28361.1 hypothetical protein BC659_0426 [Sediminibacterium goheungense]